MSAFEKGKPPPFLKPDVPETGSNPILQVHGFDYLRPSQKRIER